MGLMGQRGNTPAHKGLVHLSPWPPALGEGKGQGKERELQKNGKQVATQVKKPKSVPKPETKCFYCKGTGHWKRNCPKYLADKKDGKVNKGIFDVHVIDVYLTNAHSSAWVFDTGSVADICNSKQGLWIKQRLAKDEVTMRVGNGSKVDVIAVGTLLKEICPRGNNKMVIIVFPRS